VPCTSRQNSKGGNFSIMPAGRPPKPDAQKIMQGTARADRMNFDQPQFEEVVESSAPEWLSPLAQKAWETLVPDFIKSGIYKTIDMTAVAMLCSELAEYWKYEELTRKITIEKGKPTIKGDMYKIIMLKQMHFNNANKLMIQYGMTPVSRQRMKISNPQTNPIDNVLPPKPAAPLELQSAHDK
jgi:P27 family predicted phage terminase small subunit